MSGKCTSSFKVLIPCYVLLDVLINPFFFFFYKPDPCVHWCRILRNTNPGLLMMEWVWSAMCSQPMTVDSPTPPCAERWMVCYACDCIVEKDRGVRWLRQATSCSPCLHFLCMSRLQQEKGHSWITTAESCGFYVFFTQSGHLDFNITLSSSFCRILSCQ